MGKKPTKFQKGGIVWVPLGRSICGHCLYCQKVSRKPF
ncbi:hypothetical protein [cyanobacterium endosymbiont of Rhopalodia gibberula]